MEPRLRPRPHASWRPTLVRAPCDRSRFPIAGASAHIASLVLSSLTERESNKVAQFLSVRGLIPPGTG
jgi:hypothetical protein